MERLDDVENKDTVDSSLVLLQRHGDYVRDFPKDEEDALHQTSGRLTEQAIDQIREIARQKALDLLALGKPLNVILVHSPTQWENSRGERFGRRAEDTAYVVVDELARLFSELSDTNPVARDSRIHLLRSSKEGSSPGTRLEEPNYNYVGQAAKQGKDPYAYVKALKQKAVEEGKPHFEIYHMVPDELREIAKEIGAEESPDIAKRVFRQIQVLERYAQTRGLHDRNKQLVFWLESHNDSLRSLVQHEMGAGDEAVNYSPGNGEILELAIEKGTLSTEFRGQRYEKELAA